MKLWLSLLAVTISVTSLAGAACSQAPAADNSAQPAATDTAAPPADDAGKAHDNTFVIGANDQLAVSVWKEPDISRTIVVRSDGKISLPLAGEIVAAGKTPSQLEQEITAKLKNYITDPAVTVIVQQINSEKYNVLGQVTKPGVFPLTTTTTVMDAIAAAGGFRDFAKKKGIYILRKDASGAETHIPFNYQDYIKGKNTNQNIAIQPRDTIIVP